MLTTTLFILAATQPLALSGLVIALFRLSRMNRLSVQSHADLALIGTVEELLVELQEMTATALEELAHQRVQIDALLRDSEATDAGETAAPRRATPARRRTLAAEGAQPAAPATGASRRQRALELLASGYEERDIARELRAGVDEVRLLLATASRREGA